MAGKQAATRSCACCVCRQCLLGTSSEQGCRVDQCGAEAPTAVGARAMHSSLCIPPEAVRAWRPSASAVLNTIWGWVGWKITTAAASITKHGASLRLPHMAIMLAPVRALLASALAILALRRQWWLATEPPRIQGSPSGYSTRTAGFHTSLASPPIPHRPLPT